MEQPILRGPDGIIPDGLPQNSGASLIILGEPGSGKTHSLKTLRTVHRKAGFKPLEIGVLSLDKNVYPVLGNWFRNPQPDEGIVKIRTINMTSVVTKKGEKSGLDRLEDMFKNVSQLSNEQIQKTTFGSQGQLLEVVGALKSFKADDGTNWGDITTWGTNRVLVIDQLSNLTTAARRLAVGNKPALTQPDYQVIQNTLLELINTILYDVRCHVVLLAHIEYEPDEVTGGKRIFPATLGVKLAPRIGKDFSDIVLAKFTKGKWSWSTVDSQAALKTMHLPVKESFDADFHYLFNEPGTGWIARGGQW